MGRDFSKIPNGIYYLETNDRKSFAKQRVYRRKYQSDFSIHRVKKIIDRPFKRIFKIINQKRTTIINPLMKIYLNFSSNKFD